MRWLKGAVIGMGVLIVVLLTIVIVTVVRRSGAPPEQAPAAGSPSPPVIGAPQVPAAPRMPETTATVAALSSFGETRIVLPPGAEAEETLASGSRLIVRLRLPDGHLALLLIDAATGRQLGLIHLDRQIRK